MSSFGDNWYYTPAPPLPVRGGIRARSQRGAFGITWWGKRWVKTLESFHIGARLGRGKTYARGGQVAKLAIGAGEVTAEVQGTTRIPYKVRIQLRSFTAEEWRSIVHKLRRNPVEIAALLQGEMSEALDAIVRDSGLSLFPERDRDLHTDCSCPDWSNPCKHIAAVYYLLAEAFDDDPFLLLRLRGMDREQLLAQIQTAAVRRAAEAATPTTGTPLPVDASTFWGTPSEVTRRPLPNDTPAPPVAATLGTPGLWRSKHPFDTTLSSILHTATHTVEECLLYLERQDDESA